MKVEGFLYSSFSGTSRTKPAITSAIPPALAGFTASETLQVSEIQIIVVGASHLREVQTVTTSASAYAEVQAIKTSADNGNVIGGHFIMRFPEVQVIQLTATDTTNMVGYLKLAYTSFTTAYSKKYGYF